MEFPQASESTVRSEFRNRGVRSVTAAAVLLAAGALNLAAEGPAEARSGRTWDLLAGCESGGNWHTDTGNGFSGGLQIAHPTWRSNGGSTYASRAARATRQQQIQVAERVLARQGWRAWPACSASLGLGSATPHGATPHTTAPSREAAETAPGPLRHSPSRKSRDEAGRHRKTAESVVVNAGDTVSGIAYAHGMDWQEFYRQNRRTIGADPNLIFPGMRLNVRHTGTD
ncbi:transglycosylase family protein [Streptomyces sp. x-80]|uniref:LysM peptidoglycan-binding domain-containing protein n=1 Tax=Streptomyces sp. x-80 TaxID=2789282 RepID=UPI00397EDB81